jgi:hypothetical protein
LSNDVVTGVVPPAGSRYGKRRGLPCLPPTFGA